MLSMTEVLRQASSHFARTRKMQKEKSIIGMREAERYRDLVTKSSYSGEDCQYGFVYNPTFCVGERLYQFMAPRTTKRSQRGSRYRGTYHHRPRLKLLLPDTLVFNVNDEPYWYYTDKEGYVACTARFEPGQAVEQLGDVRFDDDLAAVRKQSCLLPLTKLEDGDDPAAVYSDGNTLALVNTRDLRVVAGATVAREAGGGPTPVTDGGEPFVIQKFIKSKGPHAFIVRQVLEHNLPPTAWMISNKQPYGDEEAKRTKGQTDSLLLAGPGTIGRYVTTPRKDRACGITRLGPRACTETAEAANRVLHHLEAVLEKHLSVLVCDFTKDDRGRLWFLQVKAFRFLGCSLRRPFRLTSRMRRDARLRLMGENLTADGAAFGTPRENVGRSTKVRGRRRQRNDDTRGNGDDLDNNLSPKEGLREGHGNAGVEGGKVSRRILPCGMCGVLLRLEELSYSMTTKMVRDTLVHIWSRLPPSLVPQCLSVHNYARGVSAGMGVISAEWRNSDGGDRNVRACEACFAVQQMESMLVTAERRIAIAVGAARENNPGFAGDRGRTAEPAWVGGGGDSTKRRIAGRQKKRGGGSRGGGPQLALMRRWMREKSDVERWGRVLSRRDACEAVDPLDVPQRLTLCRILLAITDLLDMPTAFLQTAVANGHSLELRYDMLGRREAIILQNPADTPQEEEVSGDEVAGEAKGCPGGHGDRGLVNLPVRSFRVFSFLAPGTPLKGDLPKWSGLDKFLSSQQEEVVVSLHLVSSNKNRKSRAYCDTNRRRSITNATYNSKRESNVSSSSSSSSSPRPHGEYSGAERDTFGGDKDALENDDTGRACRRRVPGGRVGYTRLRLEQLRNEHIERVELQAPLMLKSSHERGDRSSLVLVKAFVGLERVRNDVNASTLAQPLLLHKKSIFVVDGGSAVDDFHPCDPLPGAWVHIPRSSTGNEGFARQPSALTASRPDVGRSTVSLGTFLRQCADLDVRVSDDDIVSRAGRGSSTDIEAEQNMENNPNSVWGMCLCINGIRHPEGLKELLCRSQAQRSANKSTHTQQRFRGGRWGVRYTLFGHRFYAERPAYTQRTPADISRDTQSDDAKAKKNNNSRVFHRGTESAEKGAGLQMLAGLEAHSYLQCGISRLREALCNGGANIGREKGEECGDGDSRWCAALNVELLCCAASGGEGRGDGPAAHEIGAQDEVLVLCGCQVSLTRLVDDRFTEGAFPLHPPSTDDTASDNNASFATETLEQQSSPVPTAAPTTVNKECVVVDNGAAGDDTGGGNKGGGGLVQGRGHDERGTIPIAPPSLEVAVHLYRMGPWGGGHSSGVSRTWRPPALVEKGLVGGGGIVLFERMPGKFKGGHEGRW